MHLSLTARISLLLVIATTMWASSQAGHLRASGRISTRDLMGLNSSARIVGGQAVEMGDNYTWFADWHKGCGGSLIAPDIVLTAAHCEENPPVTPFSFGSLVPDDWAAPFIRDPIGYEVHPSYSRPLGQLYDAMLVKLAEPVYYPLMKLNPYPSVPVDGQLLQVVGFGVLNENRDRANSLMETEVYYIQDCKGPQYVYQYYSYIFPNSDEPHLCAGVPGGGQDACFGDSGGPLFYQDMATAEQFQVGIVSWGDGCGRPNAPGVYNRISKSYDWIMERMCAMTEYADYVPECYQYPQEQPVAVPDATQPPQQPQQTEIPVSTTTETQTQTEIIPVENYQPPPDPNPDPPPQESFPAPENSQTVPQPQPQSPVTQPQPQSTLTHLPQPSTTSSNSASASFTINLAAFQPPKDDSNNAALPTFSPSPTQMPTPSQTDSDSPTPQISPSPTSAQTLKPNYAKIRLEITTDDFPKETSYQFIHSHNYFGNGPLPTEHTVIDAVAPGLLHDPHTTYAFVYQGESTPLQGQYKLILKDEGGDGICCKNGLGKIKIFQEAVDGSSKQNLIVSILGSFGQQKEIEFSLDQNF